MGDNLKADIEGAKKYGMKTIFFHLNEVHKQLIMDEIIHHYDELEDAIYRINN